MSSGVIRQKYDTKQIPRIKGVLKLLPVSGTVFLLGLFAIAGTPPFSIFASELGIMAAIFDAKMFWVGFVFAILLAFVFAGIARTLFQMFYGSGRGDLLPGETNIPGAVCMVALLAVIAVTGLVMPAGSGALSIRRKTSLSERRRRGRHDPEGTRKQAFGSLRANITGSRTENGNELYVRRGPGRRRRSARMSTGSSAIPSCPCSQATRGSFAAALRSITYSRIGAGAHS